MTPRQPAVLVVSHPTGHSFQRNVSPFPFLIGRSPDCHLVLRDSRISRSHARILLENGEHVIEDSGSRHGVLVNGRKVRRHRLIPGDRIEFGIPDSYVLTFQPAGANLRSLLAALPAAKAKEEDTADLSRLRSFLEIARVLEGAFSTDDVLAAVVDAAIAVTRCQKGVLLLEHGGELGARLARTAAGASLDPSEIQIPLPQIREALKGRRELLGMVHDPESGAVCVPLVRLRPGGAAETQALSFERETVGAIYLDSLSAADLSGSDRDLLGSLALEASTILENARLLEEQREKQRLEDELQIARGIQRDLLPRRLPREGWLVAAGTSIPSSHVGGDYFDLRRSGDEVWSLIVADVAGKGVSAALLAAVLQGAFVLAGDADMPPHRLLALLNRFLYDRTEGEKYATIFAAAIHRCGELQWVNAGHCAPLLLRASGAGESLRPTATPAGLLEDAGYPLSKARLASGDKLVIYSDGFPEARNPAGELYGDERLRRFIAQCANLGCEALVSRVVEEIDDFASGADPADDRTILAVEYQAR
jgi:serine phosphatase RsbU (regulator of sigma subunit)